MNDIVLLTDFGIDDPYVGIMKGVISTIAPTAKVIDLTHAISPQRIRSGAFALLNSYTYFPAGTIFVVVIDPGVGSTRRPIVATAGEYTFIAPDNGVLSYVLQRDPQARAYELISHQHRLSRVSNTFHGRDVFAPAAAYLSAGTPIDVLGQVLADYVKLPMPRMEITPGRVRGEVLSIDHFGNVITSIGRLAWNHEDELTLTHAFDPEQAPVRLSASACAAVYEDRRIDRISVTYADVPRGSLLALVGSSGFLEIAINQGNACAQLGVDVGFELDLLMG